MEQARQNGKKFLKEQEIRRPGRLCAPGPEGESLSERKDIGYTGIRQLTHRQGMRSSDRTCESKEGLWQKQ